MELEKCKPIKQRDWKNWWAKNKKLNADIVLKIGMKVQNLLNQKVHMKKLIED